MEAERQYDNGRIRVRPDQIEYLDRLLHNEWVRVAGLRAQTREALLRHLAQNIVMGPQGADDAESGLITEMNRELRLIKSIQDEIGRTREDMGLG